MSPTPDHNPWGTLVGVSFLLAFGIAGCSSETVQPPPKPAHPVKLVSAAEFAALPELSFTPVSPACIEPGDQEVCDVPLGGGVASGAEATLILFQLAPGALHRVAGEPPVAHAVGRRGEGPGEFRIVATAGIGSRGDILAFDPVLRRVLSFGADGRYVSMRPIEIPPGFIQSGFVDSDLYAVSGQVKGPEGGGDSVDVALYGFELTGAPRLVALLPPRIVGQGIEEMIAPPPLFAPQPLWQITSRGSILYSDGSKLAVAVFDTLGATQLAIEVAVEPRSVTEAEFVRERDARLSRMSPGPMGRAMRQQLLSAPRIVHHAGATDLRQLENGQIWLREAPQESGEVVGWVGFDAGGAPIGRVVLGSEAKILASRDSLILLSRSGATMTGSDLVWMRLGKGPN